MSEKFQGLNNLEIVFVFYRLQKQFDKIEKNISNNIIVEEIETPVGTALAKKKVSDKVVEAFKKDDYYILLKSSIEKLKPVVEIIESSDDEVIKILKKLK
jgi:hypothetical protein